MEIISISHGEGESSRANDQKPIQEFTQQELDLIKQQVEKYLAEAKKLQKEADRESTSCIYRVLPRLKKINDNFLYEPNKVSIGPYYCHLRNEKLKMAEDYKTKCVGSLLVERARNEDMQINFYKLCLQRIRKLEGKIRNCYSQDFEVPPDIAFLETIVVDACFILGIIEMFGCRKREVVFGESLAVLAWIVPYFYRYFLLLENQIPFFVLTEIYALVHRISVENSRPELIYAALKFFNLGMKRSDLGSFSFMEKNFSEMDGRILAVLHLLDLVRLSFIPSTIKKQNEINVKKNKINEKAPSIPCISKLQLAGIKVSLGNLEHSSFLEVKFKKGVIEMPNISINDFMKCLLLNCVAFEQCHQRSCDNYFTVYAAFLDNLVNAKDDVEYLRERNVIDIYLADDSEVVNFINHAGKDLVLNTAEKGFYLKKLFDDVDKHYKNSSNWKWARFEREYIDKPWLLLSAAGGILLLLATLFQAVMAFLSYKYAQRKKPTRLLYISERRTQSRSINQAPRP